MQSSIEPMSEVIIATTPPPSTSNGNAACVTLTGATALISRTSDTTLKSMSLRDDHRPSATPALLTRMSTLPKGGGAWSWC